MVKKDKRTTSSPVAPMQLQPPLKPLHIASPSVALDQRSCNAECSYEYDNLLARSRLSVRPFPPVHDLEERRRNDGQWQVLQHWTAAVFGHTPRARTHTNVERDADVPPPSCMMGPHWHLMLTTWSKAEWWIGAGLILSGLCLTCYALVGCSNPGIVRGESIEKNVPPDDTYTFCDHCDSYRPKGTLLTLVRS
ncbi:hypothetical protein GQ600_420 [Phytophthora cactorum]|nr:hypothetical protein GQ600_420 [Phytophthora cactorum]